MSDPSHVDHGPPSAAPLSPPGASAQAPCDSSSRRRSAGAAAPPTAEHEVLGASAMAPPADGGVADDATHSSISTPSAASAHTHAHRGTSASLFPSVLNSSMPAQSQLGAATLPQGQPSNEPLGTDPGASADPMPLPHTKRARPPVLDQRQQSSSLLTQALATARGIPPQTSAGPSTTSKSTTSSTYTGPQTPPSGATTRVLPGAKSRLPHHPVNHSATPRRTDTAHGPAPSFKDDGSRPEDAAGGSLMPKAGATSTTAASPDPATPTLTSPDSGSLSSSHTMSAIGAAHPVPAQHHIFPSKGVCEPSPIERIERDIRALERQKLTRAYTQPPKLEQPSTTVVVGSPEKDRRPMSHAPGFVEEDLQRARPGTKVPEPRYSIGPEKMWSIGSGQLDDAQDGQVEKSIAKAMAKEEHNNRSRKASHTLGFFREGLPEDNTRRKGAKGAAQTRAESTAERAGRGHAINDIITEDPPALVDPLKRSAHSPRKATPPVVPRRPTPPPDTPGRPGEPADTTSAVTDARRRSLVSLQPPSPAPSNDGSATAAPGDNVTVHRPPSSASSKEGHRHDEGEESGEEKISSAFFLPHQDLERPMDEECTTSGELDPATCHGQLRGRDRSPWLVKADEPEPEDHTPPPTPPSSQSGRGDRRTSSTEGRDTAMVCEEVAIVDEPEKTLPSSMKTVSHPTLLYHDNYRAQQGDQKAAKQPLEAIELIPYNHQVGGHTPLWRFSKRAVCKKLNNRENEFYETVEHFHRDLLRFLPRYVPVFGLVRALDLQRSSG